MSSLNMDATIQKSFGRLHHSLDTAYQFFFRQSEDPHAGFRRRECGDGVQAAIAVDTYLRRTRATVWISRDWANVGQFLQIIEPS